MTTSSAERIVIHVDGVPKILVSIRLSHKDDLYIILKRGDVYRDHGRPPDDLTATSNHGRSIAEQKYSVHPSPGLPGENLIHHTLRLAGCDPIKTRHYTSAIKSGDRFALLFAKRAPDMMPEKYTAERDRVNTSSIGAYQPKRFTLFYSVLVGPARHQFVYPLPGANHEMNIHQRVIAPYRIVTLYSFLSLPSHSTGDLTHYLTMDHRTVNSPALVKSLLRFKRGVTPAQAMYFTWLTFGEMAQEMLKVVEPELHGDPALLRVLAAADFYREGTKDSPSWARHVLKLSRNGLGPVGK